MNDMYEIFGNLYKDHLESIGIYESGMIIFKEVINGIEHNSIVRVEYDDSDIIFENDFYEGQPCTFIACFTDSEIATRLMGSIGENESRMVYAVVENTDSEIATRLMRSIRENESRMVYADVENTAAGKWIAIDNCMYSPFDGSDEYVYYCNKCGYESEKAVKRCPNCGSKMKEGVLYAKR